MTSCAATLGHTFCARAGAKQLLQQYDTCRAKYAGKPFRGPKVFEKAYLIHLLQEMIEADVRMAHVDTPGDYWEIDTQQDFAQARKDWPPKPAIS